MLTWSAETSTKPVLRHNYGILFEPMKTPIPILHDNIIFNMSSDIKLKPPVYMCRVVNESAPLAAKLAYLNQGSFLLSNLIRDNYIMHRHTRALLGIVGRLLKSLFGVETEEDVNKLKGHLNILDHTIHDDKHYMISRDLLIARLAYAHHKLILHMRLHIKEAESLFNHQSYNTEQLHKTNSKLISTIGHKSDLQDCLWKITQAQEYYSYLLDLIYTFERLSSGYLSKELVNFATMISVIDKWKIIAFRNYTMSLVHTSPRYYFNTKLYEITLITEHCIKYTVSVNARFESVNLDQYRISIFPVPSMAHNFSLPGYTVLKENSKFLLVNSTHHTESYHKNTQMLPMIIRPIRALTCVLALYLDLTSDIKILCRFDYISKYSPIFQHVPVTANTHILINPTDEGIIVCGRNTTTMTLAPLSIINIACGCYLETQTFSLKPMGASCNIEINSVINTGINIPMLTSVNLTVNNLGGGDLIELNKIHLSIIHANFSTQIGDLNLADGNIRDIFNKARDLMSKDRKYSEDNSASFVIGLKENSPIAVCYIISIISLVVSLYILYRLHGLFAILTLVGAPTGEAVNVSLTQLSLPDFGPNDFSFTFSPSNLDNDTVLTPEQGPTVDMGIESIFLSDVAVTIYAVIFGICVALAVASLRKYYKSGSYRIMGSEGTHVYLKIKFGETWYSFPISPVLHTIPTITCAMAPKIVKITPKRFWPSSITISWSQMGLFEYNSGGRSVTLPFKSTLIIPSHEMSTIRRALSAGACQATLYIADGHNNTMQLYADAFKRVGGSSEC